MSGRCLCGAVTFEARGVHPEHHACHCDMCRRWGGAPFFGIHCEQLLFAGEDNIERYASSEWAERGFCKRCGSNLFYYAKPSDHYSVVAGVFDDASAFRLTSEIYVDHQPAGYRFAGDLERYTEAEILEKWGVT